MTQPGDLTLTASEVVDPDGTVERVEFYLDGNDNGMLEPGSDTLLGSDTSPDGGWTWTGSSSTLPPGVNWYFARAQDDDGAWSNVVDTMGTVVLVAVAEIRVTGDGLEIADGDTTPAATDGTDFGSAIQGQASPSRTFRVWNDGAAALTTSGFTCPAGFTCTDALASSIGAGSYDDFTLQLDTDTAGTYSGDVRFANNDADENPFNFRIAGTVEYGPDPVVRAPDGSSQKANNLVLKKVGDHVQVTAGALVLLDQTLASINSLRIVGVHNKSDVLTVDNDVGGAFRIPGGVTFEGDAGTKTDSLVVRGASAGSVFALSGETEAGTGVVAVDDLGISFSGVEQVRFEGLAGNDTFAVSALPAPLAMRDTGGADTLDFTGVTQQVSVNPGVSSPQKIFGLGNALTLTGKFETTIVQYGPNPEIIAPAGKGGNSLLLARRGDYIQLLSGKNILLSQPLGSQLASLRLIGASAKADTLTVDFSAGVFSIPGGVTFVGGDGAKIIDTLVLRGTVSGDTFQLLADHAAFATGTDQTAFPFSEIEQLRFEGLAGDDTYAVSALPVSLTVNDTAGTETVDFSGATAGEGVTVALANSSAQKAFGGTTTLTVKGKIENATGTPYADKIAGSSAANLIRGLAGDDTILGGAGDDTIYGGEGNDWLYGDAGNDILQGGPGNNVLLGGAGNDVLDVNVDVTAGTGRNLLIGGVGLDTLQGGLGEEILIGSTTKYDAKPLALAAIMEEWASDTPFLQRQTHLIEGITVPDNPKLGLIQLVPKDKTHPKGTVLDDKAIDQLLGGPGDDWFFPFGSEVPNDG